MPLVIRLKKIKQTDNYNIIIVNHKQKPNSGKLTTLLGTYTVHQKKITLNINRLLLWISRGVKLTPRVEKILIDKFNCLNTKNETQY